MEPIPFWEEVNIEAGFEKGWKKYIAKRGNEFIQKLTKYVNPQGQSFNNHGKALEAQQLNSLKKLKQGNANVDPETSMNKSISNLTCCRIQFNHPQQLEHHMKTIHKENLSKDNSKSKRNHPCNSCSSVFPNQKNLKQHIKESHKPKKTYNCNRCEFQCDNQSKLKVHVTACNKASKKIQVPVSNKMTNVKGPPGPPGPSFSSKLPPTRVPESQKRGNLTDESRMEEEDAEEFFCEDCGLEYYSKAELQKHLKTAHDEESPPKKEKIMTKPSFYEAEPEEEETELEDEWNGGGPGDIFMEKEVGIYEKEEIEEISSAMAHLASNTSKFEVLQRSQKNFKMINDSFSDEDEESVSGDNEDQEYYDDFSSDEGENEIVLDEKKVPDEITLDEDDTDTDDDDIVDVTNNERYQYELRLIEKYEEFLGQSDNIFKFVVDVNNEHEKQLRSLLDQSWFSKPREWKPANPWESWNATVSQICTHFKLRDFTYDKSQVFSSYEEFDEYVTPIITSCNPHRNQVELFKLKKAKWFQTLDPVIPEHMKFVEESIDDDDDDFE